MIGVFDSGFGGMTVLKELMRVLPQYKYLYLGDNARAPYGNKSEETIFNYSRQAVEFLFGQGCYIVILACNTASAEALRRIQQEYLPVNYPDRRVLGVIIPAAEEVARQIKKKKLTRPRVGLIATRSTVNSGVYEKEIKKLNRKVKIYSVACPLLVNLVEENWLHYPETKIILARYLAPLKKQKLDYLLLGCTHYPFLYKRIKDLMGPKTKIINPPPIIAAKLKDYLLRHPEIEKKLIRKKSVAYNTTDEEQKFLLFCEKRLKMKSVKVKKVILSD